MPVCTSRPARLNNIKSGWVQSPIACQNNEIVLLSSGKGKTGTGDANNSETR